LKLEYPRGSELASIGECFDREQLRKILRKHLRFLNRNELLPDDRSLFELGLDSVSTIDLLLEVEKTFECSFPDEFLNEKTFVSFNSLYAIVASLARNEGKEP
jgi:acyl carrier protein